MRWLIWLGVAAISSCSVEPQAINYGHDHCTYCKMTIVDDRYGSELVTAKGKVFKFDAVECLINFNLQNPSNERASFLLVADYSNPPSLVDASGAFYLRSVRLPSPMGMYITGFKDKAEALKISAKVQGSVYTWAELLERFEQLPVLTHSTTTE